MSEPYEKISQRTGKTGHMIDLEILSAFDRNPESKVLAAFPKVFWVKVYTKG